jgi:uncharacterized protein (TIGR00106 family)
MSHELMLNRAGITSYYDMEFTNKENVHKVLVHAEVSLMPIGSRGPTTADGKEEEETSMSKEIAVAFDAISKVDGLKTILTPMGTLIESENLSNIFKAVELAHRAVKNKGIKRIITSIRLDERIDSPHTLEEKVESVKKKLPL